MAQPTLEDLYRRFRAHRDANALAEIFDRTASELLLVAVHLVGDRAEAEDLLQGTFVALIEQADAYDPARPLKPWIVGILANRAKMAIRRRRRTQPGDTSEPFDERLGTNPVSAAEANETSERVLRALDGLPSQYRHVLVLHLVHGLGGTQIAHSLDKPPATVRTQIKRGLEMLRSALPATLAAPLALLATEGRGLAAVRSEVVAHADRVIAGATPAAGAVLATVTATGGILVMKKLIAAAVAAIVAFGAWQFVSDPEPVSIETPTGNSTASASTTADWEPVSAETSESDVVRRDVDVQASPTSEATVRGRLVAAWDGSAQVGDRITIRASAAPDARGPSSPEIRDLAVGPSASDGRFEFRIPFEPATLYSIGIVGTSFVPIWGSLPLRSSGVLDLGDVEVQAGPRLRVRVVDTDDQPIPDTVFVIHYPSLALGFEGTGTTANRTDAHGILTMPGDDRVPAGTIELDAPEGLEIIQSRRFRIVADAEFAEPTVVVRRRSIDESIRGVVVDARNQPVADAQIRIDGRRSEILEYEHSNAAGEFVVFRRAGDPERVRLKFLETEQLAPTRTEPLAWGTHDLVVVQPDAREVTIRVVDADSREPLTDFELHFAAAEDPLFGHGDLRRNIMSGPHVDGLVRLRGLPPAGTLAVVVEPLGDDYEITRQLNLDLGALGSMPIEITLHRRAPVTIHIEDEDGSPVAGSHVRIVQCRDGELLAPDTLVIDRSTTVYNMHPRRKAGWPVAFAVDEGETDTNGDVTLRCVPNAPSVGILVTGGAHATRFLSDARLDPADPTLVTVGRASGVRGRLGPPGALARFSPNPESPDENRVSIAVRRPGEPITPRPGSRGEGYPIAADGSFTIPDLEPGRWEVVLYWMRATSARSSTGTVLEPPLGSVEVRSGDDTSVSYDLTRLLPAVVRGVASLDGVPVTDALVTLEGEHRSDDGTSQPERDLGSVRSDAEGKFAIGGLLPGRYVVRAHTIDESGNERTLWSEAFDVARGAEIDRVFHMR